MATVFLEKFVSGYRALSTRVRAVKEPLANSTDQEKIWNERALKRELAYMIFCSEMRVSGSQ